MPGQLFMKQYTGVTPKEWRSPAKAGGFIKCYKNRRILIFRIHLFFPFIYLRIISSRPGPLDTIVIGTSISFSTNSIYFTAVLWEIRVILNSRISVFQPGSLVNTGLAFSSFAVVGEVSGHFAVDLIATQTGISSK